MQLKSRSVISGKDHYKLLMCSNCQLFSDRTRVVCDGREEQSQKEGSEWTHSVITMANSNPLKHQVGNKLQFAHQVPVKILL